MKPLNKNEDDQKKKTTLESKHLKYVIRFGVHSLADSLWLCCRGLNNDWNKQGRSADWTLEEFKFFLSSDGELNINGIWYFQQNMENWTPWMMKQEISLRKFPSKHLTFYLLSCSYVYGENRDEGATENII